MNPIEKLKMHSPNLTGENSVKIAQRGEKYVD